MSCYDCSVQVAMLSVYMCYRKDSWPLSFIVYPSISLPVCADLSLTSHLIPNLTVLSRDSLRHGCLTHSHMHTPESACVKKSTGFCSIYSGHISTILLQFCPPVLLASLTFPLHLSFLTVSSQHCCQHFFIFLCPASLPLSPLSSLCLSAISRFPAKVTPSSQPSSLVCASQNQILASNSHSTTSSFMLHINQRFILELRFWWSVHSMFTHCLSIHYCSHTTEC